MSVTSQSSLTVGGVLTRLCGVHYVSYDGASLFHDEFGHIISSILLTRWPTDSRISAPVVWSTDTIIPEQLAELCQRMLVRASPRNVSSGIAPNRIHVAGTLDDAMMQRIEDKLFTGNAAVSMNWPNEQGEKHSKTEALAWTYLFAVEDIHIIAERCRPPLDLQRLNGYRESVAELMYTYALDPEMSSSKDQVENRHRLIRNCYEILDVPRDEETEVLFGHHMSDALLNRFYETFLPHFDALDAEGVQQFGRAFSRHSVQELHALDTRFFLPSTDPPFEWIFEGEPVERSEKWLGVLRYDKRRELWVIVDVKPPLGMLN